MIKFFRQIRNSLLMENKTSKYFKYAIGEIILVMIGILLALQVNNWNEQRKTRVAEQLLLSDLKEEISSNHGKLVEAMSYHSISKNGAKKLLEIYNGTYQYKNEREIDSLLGMIQWAWTYDPSMGILDAIKLSGHLNSVQNAELRALIATYEDHSQDTREENNLTQDLIINKYMPLVNRYVSLIQRTKFLGEDFVSVSKSNFKPNYKALFKDRELESIIEYIHTWRITELQEGQNLLE